nr:pitrilysin family protein [Sphingomicrobium sp. B8]
MVATPTFAQDNGSAIDSLVEQVAIPHETFKLDNGLTVIVHEDRKAPIVAVSMWYNVGSKDEPKGKTGFAHLFEHLMFNGSENLPGDYFEYTEQIGATSVNGTTWFDRTNYFQNVPTGALERALFMESDRMGYLLGAVTQEKLTNQIGVVQNEKRSGDNQPGGLVSYEKLEALFPEGHPYRHSTIGSMADLSSATMGDVQQWFIDKYGPNNAILVLAGDMNAAEARPLVEKYFGAIPAGPVNTPAAADVPTLEEPKRIVMKDRVATTQVRKYWAVGGLRDEDKEALQVASQILGGLASSRFDEKMVRGDEVAVRAWTSYQPFHRVGEFSMTAEVKPGEDPNKVETMMGSILADFVINGPTEDEIERAVTSIVAGQVRGLERVGGFSGKANTLAEGLLYEDNSDAYAEALADYAALTPEDVRAAAAKWLVRPPLTISLVPGERPPYVEPPADGPAEGLAAKEYEPTPREIPPIGETEALDFPDVTHTTLSNGIELHYAQRDAVPLTVISMQFDAGRASDALDKRGLASMATTLLSEGAGGMDAQAIAEEKERLGAQISIGSSLDDTSMTINALSANLAGTLDLAAKFLKEPTFAEADINRVRAQRLAAIAQAKNNPNFLMAKTRQMVMFPADHPYSADPLGDETAISGFTRDDMMAFTNAYLRPENAEIFVVSDLPLEEVKAALEAEFSDWTGSGPVGTKVFPDTPLTNPQRDVIVVSRPDSPQSVIGMLQFVPVDPMDDLAVINAANEALGGNFLARLNMDLRETKGWSYGVRGAIQRTDETVGYIVNAPVQTDKTAESIKALDYQIRNFLEDEGVKPEELSRIQAANISALPGQFETSAAVLGAMVQNDELGRPDDYYEKLSEVYAAQTQESLDKALRDILDPDAFTYIVVGDVDEVIPQLEEAGLTYEVLEQ